MSITQSIHRGRHMYGEKCALAYSDRRISFAEVYDQVSRCAAVFAQLDPGDEVRVGILSLNSDRAILSFHGAIWAGMVPNYLNIRWAAPELSQSIDDFLPSMLVVDDVFIELGLKMRDLCDSVKHLVYIGEKPEPPEGAVC